MQNSKTNNVHTWIVLLLHDFNVLIAFLFTTYALEQFMVN